MNIVVVVVTYNRLEKLKKCLTSYEMQTFLPCSVYVVDNHSMDGTAEYLDSWAAEASAFGRKVLHSDVNLGGAGGFAWGIKNALAEKPDWIWIADDDAYLEPGCLEKIALYYSALPLAERESTAALCAKVQGKEGISYLHRRRIHRNLLQLKEIPLSDGDYAKKSNEIDLFSFVGTAIRGDIVAKAGYPRADFFIMFDDSEYSLRCGQYGKICCLSDAVVFHDSAENEIEPKSWKHYYAFRNKIYTYRLYFSGWHCFAEYIKHLYMVLRYYNNVETWKQLSRAWRDARKGELGKNNRYLPG